MGSHSEADSGSSNLLALPNELLHEVLTKFCKHCYIEEHEEERDREEFVWSLENTQSLYSTCLVSWRLRDIAQPILYHECILLDEKAWGESKHSLRQRGFWTRRFTSFLRTVTLRPDLAAVVRTWSIDYRAIRDFQAFIDDEVWAEAEQRLGIMGALPGLSSVYAPSTLCLEVSHATLSTARLTSVPIQHIHCSGVGDGAVSPGFLDGILQLCSSTLKTIHLDATASMMNRLSNPFPNLRRICIRSTPCSKSDMASFLSRCTAGLEAFTYCTASRLADDYARFRDPFLASDAITLLAHHRATLKALHLDITFEPMSLSMAIEPSLEAPMPSLRTFSVLENLSVNSDFLLHFRRQTATPEIVAELLPPSLVSLRVVVIKGSWGSYYAEDWMYQTLDTCLCSLAMAVGQGLFPELTTISYDTVGRVRLPDVLELVAGQSFVEHSRVCEDGMPKSLTVPVYEDQDRRYRKPHVRTSWTRSRVTQ
ncbi:hypothetical protein GE09DRAFT_702258 [Coniochaeta sp. 2T2.1]|nr:hypothetical protein GE09DRAFT_702258 [Coniochaeta sp. 2T2.1]